MDAMTAFGTCPGSSACTDLFEVQIDVQDKLIESMPEDFPAIIREWTMQREVSLCSEITRRTYNRDKESMEPVLLAEFLLLKALARLPSCGNIEVKRGVSKNVSGSFPNGKKFVLHC